MNKIQIKNNKLNFSIRRHKWWIKQFNKKIQNFKRRIRFENIQ